MPKVLPILALLVLTGVISGCADKYFYAITPDAEPKAQALTRVSGVGLAGCWQSEISERTILMRYTRLDAQNYLIDGPPEKPRPGYAASSPIRVRVEDGILIETTYQNLTSRYDYSLDGDRLVKQYRLDSDQVPPEVVAAGEPLMPSAFFRVADAYCNEAR